jgi:hypothetical protein
MLTETAPGEPPPPDVMVHSELDKSMHANQTFDVVSRTCASVLVVFATAACTRSSLGETDAAIMESPASHDAYWCKYGEPPSGPCFACSGGSFSGCREGVVCRRLCKEASECPAPNGGTSVPECAQTQLGGECILFCGGDKGECSKDMECVDGICFYMFQDTTICRGGP